MLKLFYLLFSLVLGSRAMQLIVPLYIYPSDLSDSGPWSMVARASDSLSVVAIINPNSGPGLGDQPDSNYIAGIQKLLEKGVHVIGYVPTNYGFRNIDQVIADIDKYFGWSSIYRPGGVFFDETSSDESTIAYYQKAYNHTRKLFGCHSKVVLNPGTVLPAVFMPQKPENRTADTVCVFENTYAEWEHYQPSDYQMNVLVASESAAIVHTCANTASMENAIQLAQSRNVGFIYVTDRVMNNPYDLLPTYFNEMVLHIASLD
jgi:hypothetical protein